MLQLLKDWKNAYSTGRGSAPDADVMASIQTTGHSDGHWNMNAEVIRRGSNSQFADSFRHLEEALAWLREYSPTTYAAIGTVFINDIAGDADYEHLKRKVACLGINSQSKELLERTERGIFMLTMHLIDKELRVIFPEAYIRTTHRRQTMEESYQEINRVFNTICEDLAKSNKRYRNKAYTETAHRLAVSKATVERAVHFCNQAPKKETDS